MTFIFFAITSVHAFQPGNTVIKECPQCKAELQQDTTLSGNTFGAKFWTDGKREAPMLPDRPRIVKCPKCSTFVWIYDAKKLGQIESRRRNEGKAENSWSNSVSTLELTEKEFLKYAESKSLSKDKELYVRQNAWWMVNDAVRRNGEPITLSSEQKANMVSLLDVLNTEDPDQRITKAELYRELGRFEDCISMLNHQFKQPNYTKVAEFIQQLAEQKNTQVKEIKFD
ncbi:hypothetical protein PDESU_03898 [Pontiella desulfatans]|uniref:DUF2225 domain-containing protein n=2 Tax=Pontiella desulfatans TaxID=2750659 RepID=A0A6C2U7D9_PONDE|nr:hypothetical protein PDESU_03898 [Pontiella desulfatans]